MGGYSSCKYLIEGVNCLDNIEFVDFLLICLVEVYCIYVEVICELNNGNILDEDFNFFINKNCVCVGVVFLINVLIVNVWDVGYWDYVIGKIICKKMNMLDEICRECVCEFFGEGFCMDDLKCWGIVYINLIGCKLG